MTHEVVMITNDSNINTVSACDLLQELALEQAQGGSPFFWIMCVTKKCKLVKDLASHHKIHLIYPPAYTPNLNVIERLWRHGKHQVLYSRCYASFPIFISAIMGCIDSTQACKKWTHSHLFSLKSQILVNSQIMSKV